MKNVTAVVVNYCTPEHLIKAVESIRTYYPDMRIIVIDGSPAIDYSLPNVEINHVGKNIGHGHGMNIGMAAAITEYVLFFDSDIELIGAPLEGMVELMEAKGNAYGCGLIQSVNRHGFRVNNGIKYLHPHFALVRRNRFSSFSKYIHHGAPFIKTMIEIGRSGEDILIEFPVPKYVLHAGKTTRSLNPEKWQRRYWDKFT